MGEVQGSCLRFRRMATEQSSASLTKLKFMFADEAKHSIGKDGHYLLGAGITATEAFGAIQQR